ncbi:MAG: tripartite tricarboxylate transporter substrate binding protein [Betaproteobacteria bacterium]|nr:tripartite tricarboxylate transporter substrate binding protein [Betaproteobacteria bacterium]
MGSLHTLAACALAIAAASGYAQTPPYPVRPIRLIVPNAPAGLADIGARMVAAKLTEALGQQVVVDNRPGAGGTLGTAAAVRATPDGYTLLAVFDSHATNPHLFRNLEYDTIADLAPISLLVRGPLLLAVSAKSGVRSVQELIRLAKAKPGALNFATVGPGSPARLLMELLKLEGQIEVTNVPYKGAGLAVTDLASGQVDAMFATVPTLSPYVKTGWLHAIAITSAQRSPAVPGVPTMSETFPRFTAESWVGMLAPAKTPRAIVALLNAALVKILAQPELKTRFAELGYETVGSTPAQFDRWIRAETERWGNIIRTQKIALE